MRERKKEKKVGSKKNGKIVKEEKSGQGLRVRSNKGKRKK